MIVLTDPAGPREGRSETPCKRPGWVTLDVVGDAVAVADDQSVSRGRSAVGLAARLIQYSWGVDLDTGVNQPRASSSIAASASAGLLRSEAQQIAATPTLNPFESTGSQCCPRGGQAPSARQSIQDVRSRSGERRSAYGSVSRIPHADRSVQFARRCPTGRSSLNWRRAISDEETDRLISRR